MLHHECRTCAPLRLAVETRVVDRDRRTPAEVLREFEILLVEQSVRFGGDQHQRAERAARGGQWDAHCGLHAELAQDFVMFLAQR